jgi:hypothetical protein
LEPVPLNLEGFLAFKASVEEVRLRKVRAKFPQNRPFYLNGLTLYRQFVAYDASSKDMVEEFLWQNPCPSIDEVRRLFKALEARPYRKFYGLRDPGKWRSEHAFRAIIEAAQHWIGPTSGEA